MSDAALAVSVIVQHKTLHSLWTGLVCKNILYANTLSEITLGF